MPKTERQEERPEDEAMKLDEDSSRSDVLTVFALSHSSPRPQDVKDWQARFPRYGSDILELALTLVETEENATDVEWDELRNGASRSSDDAPLRRVSSLKEQRAFRVRFMDEYHGGLPALSAEATFQDVVLHFGTDYPTLAAHLDIAESVIIHIGYGEMLAPYNGRLVTALAAALESTSDQIVATLDRSRAKPDLRFGTGRQYSFAELVKRAEMNAERKAYWLDGKPSSN